MATAEALAELRKHACFLRDNTAAQTRVWLRAETMLEVLDERDRLLHGRPAPPVDTDLISDGYHTFGELYDHRITLYLALCRTRKDAWKSRVHSDGSRWPGWFIAGIGREPGKQITYHLPDARWDEATMPEEDPPPFDGHRPEDVLKRLAALESP